MARVLLDTDILSEIVKAKDAVVTARAREYLASEGRFTIPVLAVMEVVYGFQRIGRDDRIDEFRALLNGHDVLVFDTDIAALAGRIYAKLERAGRTVGLTDVMIAAVAVHHGLGIATGNVRHFEAIRDAGYEFDLENWRLASG